MNLLTSGMIGLFMTAGIWLGALGITRIKGIGSGLRGLSRGLGSEHAVLVLLLLASRSSTIRAGAADTLNNPFTIETVARGVFTLIALMIVTPRFVPIARLSLAVRRHLWGVLLLAVYWATAALSITYSAAWLVSAGKVFEIGVAFMLLWVLANRPDAEDAIKRTIGLLLFLEATLILVAVVGFFVLPSTFSETLSRPGFFFRGTMSAPFGGPNGFSAMGAILAAFGLGKYLSIPRGRPRSAWLYLIGLGVAATALSSGRQGIIILVTTAAILLFLHRRELFILLLGPGTAAFVYLYWDQIWGIVSRDQVAGSLDTLTGRTTIWAAAVAAWVKEPITGYGYGAGSRFVALASIGKDELTHAHNGFLETLLGVGLLGFIPFIAAVIRMLIWSTWRLLRRIEPAYAILPVALTMQNMVGLGFGSWLNNHLLMFGFVVALSDVQGLRPAGGRRARRRSLQRAR